MSAATHTALPGDMTGRLNGLGSAACPDCHQPLQAEADDRMDTGFAWACTNPDCDSAGGCWPVMAGDIRRAMQP